MEWDESQDKNLTIYLQAFNKKFVSLMEIKFNYDIMLGDISVLNNISFHFYSEFPTRYMNHMYLKIFSSVIKTLDCACTKGNF